MVERKYDIPDLPFTDIAGPAELGRSPARRALPYALALIACVAGGLALTGAVVLLRLKLFPADTLTAAQLDMLAAARWSVLGLPVGAVAWAFAKRTMPARPVPGPAWRAANERYRQMPDTDADHLAVLSRRRDELLALAAAAGVVLPVGPIPGPDGESAVADVRARHGMAVYPPRRPAAVGEGRG